MLYLPARGSSSVAERLLAKEEVASSTLVFRSSINKARQLAGFLFPGTMEG